MNIVNSYNRILVALLFTGSAILFISCKDKSSLEATNQESTITLQGDSIIHIDSENGHRKLLLKAPRIEQYGLAAEPYTEFVKGVSFTTYDDTTLTVSSTLVADYAILLEKQQLWEAKGNVRVQNSEGRILETEQLFWNQKLEKIYSNEESKIIDGGNIIIGTGFEADQEFKDYTLRRPKGKLLVDTEPTKPSADSTQIDTLKSK